MTRGRRLRCAGALVLLTALAFALAPAQPGVADNALPDPGWLVQPTSPTTNLSDGQRVVINVESNPDVSVNAIQVRECRFGVTYSVPADTSPDNGNCPPRALSTSADVFVARGASDGLTALAKTATGASVPFMVGAGVVDWSSATNHTLTCDPTHACALVITLTIGTASGSSTVFQVQKLTFTDSNPLAACGGFATGAVSTGGSDEISDAWAQWTRAECVRTHQGAPTSVSFPGEGPAVTSFVDGDLDLVYTAAGYDSAVGLAPAGAAKLRPAVAVPVALNASVIASGGGQHQLVNGQAIGDKVRYPDGSLELSAAEVGALLGGGQSWIGRFDMPYRNDVLTRNPVLQGILYDGTAGVYAPSESLASTWFMTNYLHAIAPSDFVVPPSAPRAVVSSLALAAPPYDQINLYTGRPTLAKATVPAEISVNDGPIWTMTDLASARALDLTPVALQSGSGFVAPTAATMDAAVAAMTPDADGMLVPDAGLATTTVAAGAVQPYPLTYVLYALVPAQPLVDSASCQPRANSQALLQSWLQYLTGAGQQNLPPGMEPLPPALLAQAKTDVGLVGATKITGKCAVKKHQAGGGTGNGKGGHAKGGHQSSGGDATAPAPSDDFVSPIDSANGGSIPVAAASVVLPGKVGTPGVVRAAETSVKIPAFGGHHVVSALDGVLALLGIALLMSLAALLTARNGFGSLTPLRAGSLAVLWIVVGVTALALVLFQLGPALQQRAQRNLLAHYRVTVSDSANELQGLPGTAAATTAPEPGTAVGIVEIGALKSQDVVVEGVGAAQTQQGPGHVPGTAGLGQPGNSVLVARHTSYGGAFAHIGRLHKGDEIVVTTTQGQSVYDVSSVRDVPKTTLDAQYGPTTNDRLTLVTASSRAPWDSARATEVVARLLGEPFAPTPQGARTAAETGTHGDGSSWPAAVLVLLGFAVVSAGSVVLYRKLRFRTAYVLTSAPLVAITVIAGETLVRLLPAWT